MNRDTAGGGGGLNITRHAWCLVRKQGGTWRTHPAKHFSPITYPMGGGKKTTYLRYSQIRLSFGTYGRHVATTN